MTTQTTTTEIRTAYKAAFKAGNKEEGTRLYHEYKAAKGQEAQSIQAAIARQAELERLRIQEVLPAIDIDSIDATIYRMAYKAATSGKAYTCIPAAKIGRRFTKAIDNTSKVKAILEANGYTVQEGNDAPRGGKAGKFLTAKK